MSTIKELTELSNNQNSEWMQRAYRAGYSDGMEKILKELEEKNDGVTTLIEATQEEKDNWKYFELSAWCEKCQRGMSELWGLITYCPHCGRRIVRKNQLGQTY